MFNTLLVGLGNEKRGNILSQILLDLKILLFAD